MTNQWFRSWHGAPTDPKWLGIARKAGVPAGVVAALVWALLDRASQATERGSIAGYDADGLACFMGCETEQVAQIIALMHEKEILTDDAFTGWEKHQPKREDGAAERSKEWRERNRTQPNATEQEQSLDTDTDTERKNMSETNSDAPVPKPKKAKAEYPPAFETFWTSYPKDNGMSKAEAFKVWVKLPAEDRDKALAAIPSFKGWIAKQGKDYRVIHACNFLKQRRFDGFTETPIVAAPDFVVGEGTPEWAAWVRYRGKEPPSVDIRTDTGIIRGWRFPSMLPPSAQVAA